MNENTARKIEDVVVVAYTVQPQDCMDMRVSRLSTNPNSIAARANRKVLQANRIAAGLCQLCGQNPVDTKVKKTCYECSRKQYRNTARAILVKFGYNPDNHPELRLL